MSELCHVVIRAVLDLIVLSSARGHESPERQRPFGHLVGRTDAERRDHQRAQCERRYRATHVIELRSRLIRRQLIEPPSSFMVAEHGNVPDGRSCSPLLTSSDVKKDGLMMNKFDMPSAHVEEE